MRVGDVTGAGWKGGIAIYWQRGLALFGKARSKRRGSVFDAIENSFKSKAKRRPSVRTESSEAGEGELPKDSCPISVDEEQEPLHPPTSDSSDVPKKVQRRTVSR